MPSGSALTSILGLLLQSVHAEETPGPVELSKHPGSRRARRQA